MATANYKSGRPVMMDYTPAAAIAAGDVVIVGTTPCVAHVDNPPFGTTTIKDALAARGGIYAIATDGTPVKGQKVYFNSTTSKLTATAAGNYHFGTLLAGPTGDMVGASPASDGDIGYALHGPEGSAGTQPTPTAETGTTQSYTAAKLLTSIITSTQAGAVTGTLDTGANLDTALPNAAANFSFDWSLINLGSSSGAVTVTASTGHTIVGAAVVAIGTTGRFRTRRTAANTWVTYRIA